MGKSWRTKLADILNYVVIDNAITTANAVLTAAKEAITGGLLSINTDHANIHMGAGYCCHLYLATLDAEAKQVWLFKGPSTLYAHIKGIQVTAQGATVRVRLVKGITVTDQGTEITDAIENLNDNATNVTQSKFYDGDAAFTGGKTWCSTIVHGSTDVSGNKVFQSAGKFIQQDYLEYVTKKNDTVYALELENLDSVNDAVHIDVNMFFYEESKGVTHV